MLNKIKNRNEGFTIIEVLIVLAIAGLILLIVFLAVPALQRNSRNTQRKNEVGRFGSAIADYLSNNNGTVPTTAANLTTIKTSVGDLTQYSSTTTGTGAMTGGRFNLQNGVAVSPAPTIAKSAGDALLLVTKAECDTTAAGTTKVGTNDRQMAILYTVESGNSANFGIVCQNI